MKWIDIVVINSNIFFIKLIEKETFGKRMAFSPWEFLKRHLNVNNPTFYTNLPFAAIIIRRIGRLDFWIQFQQLAKFDHRIVR